MEVAQGQYIRYTFGESIFFPSQFLLIRRRSLSFIVIDENWTKESEFFGYRVIF